MIAGVYFQWILRCYGGVSKAEQSFIDALSVMRKSQPVPIALVVVKRHQLRVSNLLPRHCGEGTVAVQTPLHVHLQSLTTNDIGC